MNTLLGKGTQPDETITRSVVKTFSYRLLIIILDFITVYLFTGKTTVAIGFTIISNLYTTACYFIHERVWDRIKWGKKIIETPGQKPPAF